jgi:DNA-binding transcriptional ArsR family regulator
VRHGILAVDCDLDAEFTVEDDQALDALSVEALSGRRLVALAELRAPWQRLAGLINLAVGLVENGWRPVLVRSGRRGHRHLWCAMDVAGVEVAGMLARASGLDWRSGQALMRPPGWPHRSGSCPSVVTIGDVGIEVTASTARATWELVIEALGGEVLGTIEQRLGSGDAVRATSIPGSPSPLQPLTVSVRLPERLWQLVRFGDRDGRYTRRGVTDRSALTLAICNMAVLGGVHRERLWRLLLDERNIGGEGLRERCKLRGERAGRAWFLRTWDTADDGGPGWLRDTESGSDRVRTLIELAGQARFSGATGSTDRVVLSAVHQMGLDWGTARLPLSIRHVAQEAGISATTASRSLKRLRAAGWLALARTSREDRGAVYTLTAPRKTTAAGTGAHAGVEQACAQECDNSLPSRGRGTGALLRVDLLDPGVAGLGGTDAFHRLALGKGALETLASLDQELFSTARSVSQATGKHPATVRRHLLALEHYGLVGRDGVGGWRREILGAERQAEVLEQVAVDKGTTGLSQRRAERFAQERRRYRAWLLARLAVRLGAPRLLEDGTHQAMLDGLDGVSVRRRGPPVRLGAVA